MLDERSRKEYVGWLADKIPAYGDYAKEAAQVLRQQADEIERLMIPKKVVIGDNKYLINLRFDGTVDILFKGPNVQIEALPAYGQSLSNAGLATILTTENTP